MIQGDVITSLDIVTIIFSISIDFEYRLRASYPFLIVLHPISLTWISWAGIFCAVRTRTLHPFLLFKIIDCYDFPNLDVSFPIHSVDLKAGYGVCYPIIDVHVQTGAACWCTICTRAPNIFNPQIGLKCNCISLWDIICKRETLHYRIILGKKREYLLIGNSDSTCILWWLTTRRGTLLAKDIKSVSQLRLVLEFFQELFVLLFRRAKRQITRFWCNSSVFLCELWLTKECQLGSYYNYRTSILGYLCSEYLHNM